MLCGKMARIFHNNFIIGITITSKIKCLVKPSTNKMLLNSFPCDLFLICICFLSTSFRIIFKLDDYSIILCKLTQQNEK